MTSPDLTIRKADIKNFKDYTMAMKPKPRPAPMKPGKGKKC